MRVFTVGIEYALDAPIRRPKYPNPAIQQPPAIFAAMISASVAAGVAESFCSPLGNFYDVVDWVLQADEVAKHRLRSNSGWDGW
jgi:hypothetical protein